MSLDDDFEVIPEPRSGGSFMYASNLSSDPMDFLLDDPCDINALPDLRTSTTEEIDQPTDLTQPRSMTKSSLVESQPTSIQLLQPYQLSYRVRHLLSRLKELGHQEHPEKKQHLDELLKLIKLYKNMLDAIEGELVDNNIEDILLSIYSTKITEEQSEPTKQSILDVNKSAIELGVRITEFSHVICQAMSGKNFIEYLMSILSNTICLDEQDSLYMKRSTLHIILNIATKDYLKKAELKETKISKILKDYGTKSDIFLQTVSKLILIFLKENKKIHDSGQVAAVLVSWLKEGLESPKERRSNNNLHVTTLLSGLKALTSDDKTHQTTMLQQINVAGIPELIERCEDDPTVVDEFCQLMLMLEEPFSLISIGQRRPAIKQNRPAGVDLLIVGKTGTGKSATGNSILGRNFFPSKSSTTSVTREVAYEVGEFDGRVVKVVDGPGVGDTMGISDIDKATRMVVECMQDAVILNPGGYHAFLLAIKYGNRLTAEDKDAIRMLKKIFGDDFVKKYCILLMTCGDNFKSEHNETGVTFQQWCYEQKGVFKELLNECNGRVVLFDNMTQDSAIRAEQIRALLEMVDSMQNECKRYTNEHFRLAEANRNALMAQVKEPLIQEEAMKEISVILQDFTNCSHITKEDKKKLEDLYYRATQIHLRVKEADNGTGALSKTSLTTSAVRKTIGDRLDSMVKIAQEKQKVAKGKEDIQKRYQKSQEQFQEELTSLTLSEDSRSMSSQQDFSINTRHSIWEARMEEREKELRAELEGERRRLQESFEQEKMKFEHMLESQSTKSEEEKLSIINRMNSEIEALKAREGETAAKMERVKEQVKREIEAEKVKWARSAQTLTERRMEEIRQEMEENKARFASELNAYKASAEDKIKREMEIIEKKRQQDLEVSQKSFDDLKRSYDEMAKKNAKSWNCEIL